MKSKASKNILALAVAATMILAESAVAQTYPSKTVRMVIPFSAGGAADVPGRIIMQKLSSVLGQQVIVENRPGAGSTIGADIVAKSQPDGYTIFMISNTHFVSASLHKKLSYDSLNSFTPVTQITNAPNVLVVHPSLPVKSVKDLIALAKSRPGQIDFASSGNGSTQHLTGALFASMAGINITHIPYRGSGPVTADLLGGQVMLAFPGIAGMLPHIRAGKLRPLGVTGSRRSAELPDVPTIAEAGVKNYEMLAWFGVAAPKGLPRPIQMKLHANLLQVLQAPEMKSALQKVGQEPTWNGNPEQFFAFMKNEAAKWAKVVKASGAEIN